MTKPTLGPNADAFGKHVLVGLHASDLWPQEIGVFTVDHKDHGIGFAINQDPGQQDSLTDPISAFEKGLLIGDAPSMLLFTEEQPPTLVAALVIGILASGQAMQAPECPHCSEEN